MKKLMPEFVNQKDKDGNRVPVGYYKHNGPEPIKHKNDRFETPSYYEISQIEPGIYPIYVGWDTYSRHGGQPQLYVEFTGTIIDDFFPSSFGGVSTGTTKPQHVGESRKISQVLSFKDAVGKTGNSPQTTGFDIFIDPKYFQPFAHYFESLVKEDFESLTWFRTKTPGGGGHGKSSKDIATSTKHAAQWLTQSSQTLETLYDAIHYMDDPLLSKNRIKNVKWAKHFEMFNKILETDYCLL